MDYERVLATLAAWAEGDDNVRALVLTGSGAVGDAHPLSDRDLEVHARDVEPLLADESWWSGLGDLLVAERLENADGDPTRLAYFVGGKLDLTLLPAQRLAGRAYERPYRVLLDKDGATPTLRLAGPEWRQPGEAEFRTSIEWAYAAALMCAKALVRDELWSAALRDQDLKAELLRMIEWDHRARHGADLDTRYLGTRMHTWMDADVREALHDCWGHFDAVDAAHALRATVRLYASLATRTGDRWRLPVFDHARVAAEVDAILGRRPALAGDGGAP